MNINLKEIFLEIKEKHQILFDENIPINEKKIYANFVSKKIPEYITKSFNNKRYIISASVGKGIYTKCPWIAFLDNTITDTPQQGFYVVYLFSYDMKYVNLSLNQGVQHLIQEYKSDSKEILKTRAIDFRNKIDPEVLNSNKNINTSINLSIPDKVKTIGKNYEPGNIISIKYDLNNLPSNDSLTSDLGLFIQLYQSLVYNEPEFMDEYNFNIKKSSQKNLTNEERRAEDENYIIEKKKARLHLRIERSSNVSRLVKKNRKPIC